MPKTAADFLTNSKLKTGVSFLSDDERNSLISRQTAAYEAAQAAAEREQNQGGFLGGLGYAAEKIGLGFLSGIEGIWDYAAGGLAKLFGADDWAEQQIANDWVNYNHADEWFNPSEGWQFVGDVAGGIGTSLPAIAGVAAAGAIAVASGGTLSPVAATLIAGSIAGLGAAGRATKEAYDQTGELTGKEFGYGALVGVTEGAIEGVSSAIGAGTGAVVKSISKSFGKEVAKSATRNTLLKGVVKGFAGEAFEEGVQAILEPVYKRMTYDPNAKNATFQEVAYAALVGGLSGAIMGGGDVAVRNIRGTTRGNTLVNEGKAGDVITTAEQISSYQTENQTDYETFQVVQNTLNELKTSLQKTDGEVRTVRQKMLLGTLEQANTSAAFEPIVTASAENIYNNAETVAARLNELGYQDQDGKPIQITAEQIREGIDTTDAKSFRKTMSRALKTNSALRTLAVADTVGQISMDTARFRDATLAGQQLSTQADLNRFVEQATDAERQAVADRLGIENWETLTNEQFHDKITEFVANGGVREYQQERGYVRDAQAIAPESARKHLPRMVNLRNDGTYRYTQGGTDIAITKRGDSYYVYDYESGLMSKALTRSETNRVLREIHTNEQNYQNGVRQHTEAQNRLREQAAEIDAYARETISEYKNLSAAGQAAIRATIRQGRAAGVQEDFVLSCARVSARSGLRVVFSKEASFVAANGSYADGAIDLKNNRIIINPEAKSRTGESILIHELTHAIYNDTDGSLTVAEGLETMTDAEKEKIRKRYAAVGQGSALQVSDEINAHFAEQTLSNKNILERLVQKKQTLKDKILSFFRKARTDYQSDERLTGAAARLYRQYKKLFDEFSARNQRYLGVENASEQARKYVGDKHFALKTYSEKQKENWKNSKNIVIYESSEQLQEFVRQSRSDNQYSKKMYFGAIGSELAARIEEQTGLNLENYNYALRSDEVRKIFKDHGTVGTEAPRGQRPVTEADFLAIPDILDGATSITLSEKKYNGQPAIAFSKVSGNERTTVVAVVSGKHLDLRVQTEYIGIKKGTLATLSGEQAPNNTPKASRGTDSTNSISQNAENVNSESQKGKKFALAGETSETADLSLLDRAKQLQAAGEDSETIRRETGWFVGYDNQWRYEIDDSAATLVEKPAFEKHSTEDGSYRTAKLGDIMHHEELYAAYPFLKDITVILQETETGVDGSAFAEDGQIVLDQRLFTRTSKEYQRYLENRQPEIKRIEQTPEYQEYNRFYTDESLQETLSAEEWLAQEEAARNKFFASELGKRYHELMWGKSNVATTELGWSGKAKSVLMHEVQHLIQAHEGFAGGSSDTYWYNRLLKQYRSEAATVREKFLKLRIEAAPELQQAMYDMEDVLNRFDVSTSSIARAYDNAARYAQNDSQRDILWDYTQAYSKLADFYKNGRSYASDMYTNTAGEIEARDVSSRLEMTEEQRRETRPDIDRRKVYFSEKNGGGDSRSYALPDTDSSGNALSNEQREYFSQSKITDEEGRLLSLYHGSNAYEEIHVFRRGKNGYLGGGIYLTDSESYARRYADKNGYKGRIYNVYADAKNPLEVSTNAPAKEILRAIYGSDRVYNRRAAAQSYETQLITSSDIRKLREKGYDAIVWRFGGSTEVSVFEPNQIKLTSNNAPSARDDIRYALPETDTAGESLSREQREFFKDSKVVDDNGRLRVMYHGSNAEFSVFDESRISSTTKRYMAGFYFTAEKRVAEKWSRYRARTQGGSPAVFEVYLNIKNPLYLTEQEYKRLGYDEKYRESVVNQLFENQNDGILISPEQERISGLFEDSYNYELDDSVYYQSERYGITDKEYAWWLLRAVQNPDFTSTQAAVLHADQVKLVSNKQPTSNADMRFALSDSVVNVDSANETAAWTSERVTDLIERYGATNPRYTQAYATWINPADFVKATTVNQTRRNQIYDEAGNLDIDRLSHETQTPYLSVDYETMRIVGHEGRHRMAALAKAGVKRVAVAIRFTESSLSRYDARIMDGEHKLKGQTFSSWDADAQRVRTRTSHNSAAVGTLVPINAAYSAQLSEFTSERGVRFALDSSEDGNAQTRGNYSVGQRARFAANNTGLRVYTKAEAAEVINSIIEERLVFEEIGMQGELRGKDRQAVVDYLFQKLNTVKEGYRGGVALRIADYMIEHTVLTDMYVESNGEVSEAMRKLSVLRRYMHKIDLRHIQDEIQYRFDKRNSINLVWGAKEGGIAPDTLPQLLADEGIFIDAVNEADCFLQMVEMYEDARAAVNNATEQVMLSTYGDARTIKNLRQQIARDVLNAYEQKGRKSKYAKLVEKYTKQIAELKQRLRESNANNRLINSIVDQAQKMRDLKLGTFQNATQYDTEIFRSSIEKLGKIKFRGNFNIAGTRKIMADLRTWYTKDNPLLANTYEQGIADMLDEVANGKTNNYTKRELQSIRNIMAYFTNYVEHFNKVYRQGRWVDAVPEATRYIDILHRNEELKSSWFMRKVGTSYLQTFGDPMSVMRRMDRYESGFYTESFTELRDSKIDAEIAKMQLMEEYEAFLKKNKKYLAQATKETVQYRGVEIPRMQLISLYMTLKRQHAQAGLAENGFGFWNAQDQRVRVDGFAKGITEESELRAAAVEEQARIAELLTETDKEYIAILEKGYQEAGRLKADRDIQRLGFTNATEDYYYPIRRGNIAKNVDSAEMQAELDRISNASFNKDTVRGAKQELFIESADAVFNRHVRGVVQYAYISPAIETYNKLYNLDIAGTPNKPVSVSTESANVWKQGNDYFKKLITDIQGISPVSSEGRAVLSFIRGSYAKFQLGANPKVWVTQLSSLFASSSLLDASSITRGMTVSAKDVDTYCPLAKLRAQDNTAAMAQGVLDKVGRISNVLMAPIGKMDRFVVRRLFGACQVQVQKDGGAKIGTEANKIEAGKLLKRVILETQQNSLATERSAAMRSGNEIMRTLTMFSADSMKVIGRVIDSVGELSALKAKLRTTTDAESRATLQTQIKAARRNVRKSLTALATSALFMAAIAQLFNWLYNKDKDDDETAAQQVLVDFVGNLLGGLPLVRDIYSRIAEGYSVDNYAYSALNDLLDSAVNLFDTVGSLVSGDESNSKLTARTKNLLYSLGQLTGIPTRNLYNVFYGLTKRISPTTAYKIDEAFYAKNYVTDLNKAIESDDTDMISMLTSIIFGERMGNATMSAAVRNKFVDLYSKGYSVLPRSIGDTITYGGVEIPLTDEEYSRFRAIYAQSMKDIEKMVNSGTFSVLSEEMQAKAIKQVYDAYYYDALSDLVGVDERTTVGELSEWIDMSKLSVVFTGLSDIESDKNSNGETIAGSKKKNTVKYLLGQNLSDGERLLILCYRGYSIQDGDYKGYTAKRAKRILLQYILKLNGTQAEKAALAEKCGFTVRNGRIIRDF
jgi:hypothetical protein